MSESQVTGVWIFFLISFECFALACHEHILICVSEHWVRERTYPRTQVRTEANITSGPPTAAPPASAPAPVPLEAGAAGYGW